MEKFAVDPHDEVEARAQQMVKEGSALDVTEARSAAQKEIEDGSKNMVKFRPGEDSGGPPK